MTEAQKFWPRSMPYP